MFSTDHTNADVVLVGAGIMSATLGVLLKELQPELTIEIFEALDQVALESSAAWNNAGTGHSALCELNYTPQAEDGHVDIGKAKQITEQFEISRQFWSYLVDRGAIKNPKAFIHAVPHMSFVHGEKNVDYLRKRFEAMKQHHFYKRMEYREGVDGLNEWIPLMMEHRNDGEPIAATRIDIGTDVNFGALTRILFNWLQQQKGVTLHLCHEVQHIHRGGYGEWKLNIKDLSTGRHKHVHTKFMFIGAGGGALPLLEKTHISEAKGFAGFPVSGEWLTCSNPEIVKKHHAKVYGKASVGAPPMSVPHLDTRIIDGKMELLFGPFAGFSTKFLKQGSWLDLPMSIRVSNIVPMIRASLDNIPLTKYLIQQVSQSEADRIKALQEFIPDADGKDWKLRIAGQRVQVIKKDEKRGGILEFGTEVVSAEDGSVAALLGASPGASTAAAIMLDLLHRCFKDKMNGHAWQDKLKKMIPSYGQSLADNEELTEHLRQWTAQTLQLDNDSIR